MSNKREDTPESSIKLHQCCCCSARWRLRATPAQDTLRVIASYPAQQQKKERLAAAHTRQLNPSLFLSTLVAVCWLDVVLRGA